MAKKKTQALDVEFDTVYGDLLYAKLYELATQGKLYERSYYKRRIDDLRSAFLPRRDAGYHEYSSGTYFNNHDPSPLNALDRAVGNLMSYHYNPNDKFIKFGTFDRPEDISSAGAVDTVKKLAVRNDLVHKVLQDSDNINTETAVRRDTLIFPWGVKVLELDSDIIMKATHYTPEEVIALSSNGRTWDVFGVCENIGRFQARVRYPKPMTEKLEEHFAGSPENYMEGHEIEVIRLNIRLGVLKQVLRDCFNEDDDNGKALKYILKFFGITNENEHEWLDIHFTRYGIMDFVVRPVRNIIVPLFHPPNGPMSMPRSQGEKALALAITLTDLNDINLTGYERTYAPPWNFPDETTLRGADLSRDGILFSPGETTGNIKPLSLGADVGGMVSFYELYLGKLEKTFFLDIFKLVEQTHMTKGEVSKRTDEYRQASMFVASDEVSNLVPTVSFTNYAIDQHEKYGDISDISISPRYTSALAYSHRNTILERTDRIMATIGNMVKVNEAAVKLRPALNILGHAKEIITQLDAKTLLNSEETEKDLTEVMMAREKIEHEQMTANVAATYSQIDQGEGGQGGQRGNQ